MSSSNLVSLIAVPETTYGQTDSPLSGVTARDMRFTSETLSGTPQTTESQTIRTDRMSGGQVVVGLDSGGGIDVELARDPLYDLFLAAGMMSAWQAAVASAAADLTIALNGSVSQQATLTSTIIDFTDFDGLGNPLVAGDLLIIAGAATAANNTIVQVISVTDANNIEAAVPSKMVDEVIAAGATLTRPEFCDIGSTQSAFTLSKAYQDVTHAAGSDEHSQRYTGSLVNTLSISAAYGEVMTAAFGVLSNGYLQEAPSLRQQIVAAGGTVVPAATTATLNASVDVPLVTTVDGGVVAANNWCIQSLDLTLDNGLQPQNCIGVIAPTKYDLGTAAIAINASIYLSDSSYDRFMAAKLSQTPLGITVGAINDDGGYIFQLSAVQLSFPDPSSGGANTQVTIDASGVARVGLNGESSLRIYRV